MATVLITGAARGVGLALARAYLDRGDAVIAGVRDPAGAKALNALSSRGALTLGALDVADDRSIAAFVAGLDGAPVDILINNAGAFGPRGGIDAEQSVEDWTAVMAVNVYGPFAVTRALRPNLRAGRLRKVAVISSTMGVIGAQPSGSFAYRASKAAANMVMRALANDLRAEGLRFMSLHPGWVRTDMGGADADIDASESAAGLIARIDELDDASSGGFRHYDGPELPW